MPLSLRRLGWLQAPLAGAVAALGFEPLHWWPLTLLGVAWLIELLCRAPGWRRAALVGWLWGVAHFTLGNNWIATAFTYQAAMPAWLGWVGVFLLSLYLAVFPAIGAAAAWLIAVRGARGGVRLLPTALAFAGCWIVSEWLRSWVCTGFPWNPLGVAALGGFSRAGLAQLAPWLGTYALSGLVALLAASWWAAWRLRERWVSAAPLALVPLALMLVPQLSSPDRPGTRAFTLVQPDFRQEDLDDPAQYESQFVRIASLTQAARPGTRRLVFWPESGIPDYLRQGYPRRAYLMTTYAADPVQARARIARAIGPGSLLLTGAVDLETRGGAITGARNVVTALGEDGTIRASYAKAHLVPYGEYLPMRSILEPLGLSRLVPGSLDFVPGPGPRTLDLGAWGRVGVQLCYEIVFSGQVVDRAHRPEFIFNPSNDGWFGSWGPPQHLAQARLRAVEEGLPIMRATTTGISAVIDADGIVRQYVPRHVAGRLDGLIPPPHSPTLFARLGNALPLAWAALLLALSLVALRRRSR